MHYDNKPVPQNVKYTIIPARASKALSDAERSLELFELSKIFKRPTYEEQKQNDLSHQNNSKNIHSIL